ncbi:MAG: methylthioribulose-1-phosphate dehydratase [Myxococcota bacterium]|jgi:methylthioribulose-1-phosphate dehydratase
MVGTAGNLSARLSDGSLWITASGRDKGALTPADFIRLSADGEVIQRLAPEDRPSAEATIHTTVYALFPEVTACLHVHSVAANLVSRMACDGRLPLPPLEMLKGLGRWEPDPQVSLDVLPNHSHVPDIARALHAKLTEQAPDVPGFLIRDHGITAWAPTLREASNHLELLDYLFRFIVESRRLGL